MHEHSHHHGHMPDHSHPAAGHGRQDAGGKLALVLAITAGYMVLEAVAGWLTNSLALLADAGHMLTDAAAIALALFAARITRLPRNSRKTFGYYRAEILAALANAVTLILIVIGIAWEAYERLVAPPQVMGFEMMLVAVAGLVVNLVGAKLLHAGHGHSHSLNVRGVFLHIVGDALGSVAAIAAGLLLWWKGWLWADPAVSILIGVIILYGAVKLTRESLHVLMEGTPSHIDTGEVTAALAGIEHVHDVHDVHVWSVSTDMDSLTVHLIVSDPAQWARVLQAAERMLAERFGIHHTTIQVEPPGTHTEDCSLGSGQDSVARRDRSLEADSSDA